MLGRIIPYRTLIVATHATIMACTQSAEGAHDSWTVTDSGGIRIVDNRESVWSAETAWQLADNPSVVIGDETEDPDAHMVGPWDALRLSDGRIVVADRRGSALVFHDKDGRYLMRIGREGGGPGEFIALWNIARWAGDSIIAFDMGERRYSVFDAHGRFGRSYAIPTVPGYTAGYLIDIFPNGATLGGSTLGDGTRDEGLSTMKWQLMRLAPESGQSTLLPDTMTMERYYVPVENDPISVLSAPVLFTHQRVAAAFGNKTVVGSTDQLFLDIYDDAGQLTDIVRIHQEPVPISREARRAAEDLLVSQATREGTRSALRRAIDAMPTRRALPAFGRWAWEHAPSWNPSPTWFRTDSEGNLWVLSFEPPGSPARRWYVINPSGRWLGAVRMPPGFEPFDIGSDYVLGWRADKADVTLIEMYQLMKPRQR